MRQRGPTPDTDAFDGRLLVETMTSGNSALIGSCERHDQIQLRAAIDHPADAAKNSIHFAKSSKTIDVDRLQTRGLREQFLVCHVTPGFLFLSPEWLHCVESKTQSKEKQAKRTPKNFALVGCSHFETAVCTRPCICTTNNFTLISNSEFVGRSSPDENAPTVERCPCFPATVGADNPWRLS